METDVVYIGAENWFRKKYYAAGSNERYHSFQIALNLLDQHFDSPVIIETGCQRQEDDIGAGMSTSIFAEYVERYGGRLYTVDNNPVHLDLARQFVRKFPSADVVFYLSDSVEFLSEFERDCDLIYLDSWDYPIGEMVQPYGGMDKWDEAMLALKAKTDEELMQEFGHLITPCQEHCLNEFKAIESQLTLKSIVLVDDNDFPGGGKPGLLKPYLVEKDWICLYDSQQTLWVRRL